MKCVGKYIVLEGPDGSGKSTQASRLVQQLTTFGCRAVHVREPGGTRLGEAVRKVLLDHAHAGMSRRAELMLHMAARAELAEKVIRPALERNDIVVSDRCLMSSVVYQGIAGNVGRDAVYATADIAVGPVRPSLTVVVDVPVEVARARMAEAEPDRVEAEPIEFHEAVRQAYLEEAERMPGAVVVDGNRPAEKVFKEIWYYVESHVKTTAGAE